MRTLKFVVKNQMLEKDPDCDFDNLVPGTENYVQAEFIFSPEWTGAVKIAAFYSVLGKEYTPQALADGKKCFIPKEALAKRDFKVQIIGKLNGVKITTNKVTVRQNGG